jgi:tetrahydromethanopterin S-methyltransferase subunit G
VVTPEDIQHLEKRLEHTDEFASEFAAEYPEAPQEAVELARRLDEIERSLDKRETAKAAQHSRVRHLLTSKITRLEKKVRTVADAVGDGTEART